jgi:predicted DNA-binding protein (UPF0251 family)
MHRGRPVHRRRRGQRGRFPIQPEIKEDPVAKRMIPEPMGTNEPVYLNRAEAEALRLIDLEGLYQEQAGEKMKISRGTIQRILISGREKVVRALFEGRPIIIGLANNE